MTRATLLSFVLGALAPALAVGADAAAPAAPTVVVRGDGEVRVAPDMATIGLGTEHTAPTPERGPGRGGQGHDRRAGAARSRPACRKTPCARPPTTCRRGSTG